MDCFLYDNGLRHERVKVSIFLLSLYDNGLRHERVKSIHISFISEITSNKNNLYQTVIFSNNMYYEEAFRN